MRYRSMVVTICMSERLTNAPDGHPANMMPVGVRDWRSTLRNWCICQL